MVGVFAPIWIERVAEALIALGCDHGWVVHGDGLDEITTTGETTVAEVKNGQIRHFTVAPEDVGLPLHSSASLRGGDAAFNAAALRGILKGASGAYRDTVLMNAGAGLVVAGQVETLRDGVERAAQAIDEGHALAVLEKLARASQGLSHG